MFQVFLIPFLLFLSASFSSAQSLDDLNKHLQEKKSQLEPFDQSKVKIDLESLGLDDVEKKDSKSTKEEKVFSESELPKTPIEKPSKSDIETNQKPVELESVKAPIDQKVDQKVDQKNEQKKIEQKSNNQKSRPVKVESKSVKYKSKKSPKNTQAEAAKKAANSLKLQEEKLKKFESLRKRYLLELDENNQPLNSNEKIVPKKKDLNPFIDEELPAEPILNSYRTQENIHIPTIQTTDERIEMVFTAIASGDVLAFNETYKKVENPNIRNKMGDTILAYAVILKKHDIVSSILAKGADVNLLSGLGFTPMQIAIELKDYKSFLMLAEAGSVINYADGFGRTYLMHAARVGFLPVVSYLVSQNVDLNLMDSDGFTALSIAQKHKQEVIVQYLLKNGAKPWIEKKYDPKNQTLIKELENRWK